MLRFLFRLMASVCLSVAVIMAVLDATRSIAASEPVLTPLNTSWNTVSPDTLAAARTLVVDRLHPLVWDPVVVTVLNQPGFAVFLALAFLLYAIGRKPSRRLRDFAVEA